MSAYTLRLHYSTGFGQIEERLDVTDLESARELARMRLLLTRDFSHVELHQGDQPVEAFTRDSAV